MDMSAIFDIVAALALTALLAESYGTVRRALVGTVLTPYVLGVLFGVMALVQMYNPVAPYQGVIVDMRNVPIALAGAFLGWRGLLPCLAIGFATRYGLGGVGVFAGISGMAISGLAGMVWARKTAHMRGRGLGMLVLLALGMSAHLSTAVFLPREMMIWFFTYAAGPMLIVNLIAIPLIGSLLERENRRISRENRLLASATRHPETALLTGPAFTRDVRTAFQVNPLGTFAGMLVLRVRQHPLLELISSGDQNRGTVWVTQSHLSDFVSYSELAGQTADGRVLVPLTTDEVMRAEQIITDLRRNPLSGAREATINGGGIAFSSQVIATGDPGTFLDVVDGATQTAPSDWTQQAGNTPAAPRRSLPRSKVQQGRLFDPARHNALFAKADFLLEEARSY